MRSTDPTVRTEPVDDTVTMAVDYAEQDHQQLRRQGTPAAATGPDRTNDPASVVTQGRFRSQVGAKGLEPLAYCL